MLLVEQSWAQVHKINEICIFHLPTAPIAQTEDTCAALRERRTKDIYYQTELWHTCPERLGPQLRFEFPPQECSRVHFKQLMQKAGLQRRQWARTQNRQLSTSIGTSEHYSCTNDYFMFLAACTVEVQLGWDMPLGSVDSTGVLCSSGLRQKTYLTTCILWWFSVVLPPYQQYRVSPHPSYANKE